MTPRAAIVLAGGRSSRMGTDKAALTLKGRSLLARTVAACAGWEPIVVVAAAVPGDVPAGVVVTLEDPPFGGPVAGIAAGLAALPDVPDEVLLLACDLPCAAQVVAALGAAPLGPDGCCLVDAEGWPQYLAGRYRGAALAEAIARLDTPRDVSVRRLLGGVELHLVPADGITADVDTPGQADAAGLDRRTAP